MYQLYGQLEFSLVFNRTLVGRGGKRIKKQLKFKRKTMPKLKEKNRREKREVCDSALNQRQNGSKVNTTHAWFELLLTTRI